MVELTCHHLKIISNGSHGLRWPHKYTECWQKWDFSNFKPKGNPIHDITGIREEGNAAGGNALSTTNSAKRKEKRTGNSAVYTGARIHRNLRIWIGRFSFEELEGKKRKSNTVCCFESDRPSRTLALGTSPPSPHARDPATRAGTPGRHAGNCLGTESRTWKQHSEKKTRGSIWPFQ